MTERLLICGSRRWTDAGAIDSVLRRILPEVVIEGGARGADAIAKRIAKKHGIPVKEYPALWAIHGRAAGPIRNHDMLVAGKPTAVIAFTDDIDSPRSGTRHMCRIALQHHLPVTIFEHGSWPGANGSVFSYTATPDDVCPLTATPDVVYP